MTVSDPRPQATRPADAGPRTWVDAMPGPVQPYLQLMRLDRPIGIWLLLWPCLASLALAAPQAGSAAEIAGLAALFALGSVVMRGAGCTYNDIVDREIDAQVARTRGRPIPSGRVSVRAAAGFLAGQLLAGLIILLQFNSFAVVLGASSLLLVAAYPFMKRLTDWPQAWLGLTFNWGALMGVAGVTGAVDAAALLLYGACVLWTLGYDTIYAHQDIEDDALIGVRSTARLFGPQTPRALWVFYGLSAAGLVAAGLAAGGGLAFLAGTAAFAGHLSWQAARFRTGAPQLALALFRSNREAGLLLVLACGLAGLVPV